MAEEEELDFRKLLDSSWKSAGQKAKVSDATGLTKASASAGSSGSKSGLGKWRSLLTSAPEAAEPVVETKPAASSSADAKTDSSQGAEEEDDNPMDWRKLLDSSWKKTVRTSSGQLSTASTASEPPKAKPSTPGSRIGSCMSLLSRPSTEANSTDNAVDAKVVVDKPLAAAAAASSAVESNIETQAAGSSDAAGADAEEDEMDMGSFLNAAWSKAKTVQDFPSEVVEVTEADVDVTDTPAVAEPAETVESTAKTDEPPASPVADSVEDAAEVAEDAAEVTEVGEAEIEDDEVQPEVDAVEAEGVEDEVADAEMEEVVEEVTEEVVEDVTMEEASAEVTADDLDEEEKGEQAEEVTVVDIDDDDDDVEGGTDEVVTFKGKDVGAVTVHAKPSVPKLPPNITRTPVQRVLKPQAKGVPNKFKDGVSPVAGGAKAGPKINSAGSLHSPVAKHGQQNKVHASSSPAHRPNQHHRLHHHVPKHPAAKPAGAKGGLSIAKPIAAKPNMPKNNGGHASKPWQTQNKPGNFANQGPKQPGKAPPPHLTRQNSIKPVGANTSGPIKADNSGPIRANSGTIKPNNGNLQSGNSGPQGLKRQASGPAQKSSQPAVKRQRSDVGPVAAKDAEGRQFKLNLVVMNFANVGASYGKKVLKRGEPGGPPAHKTGLLDWEGVRKACTYLVKNLGLKVVGVINEDYKATDGGSEQVPMPEDIKNMCESIEETPRLVGQCHKSADDEMTIKCAYHRNCRFLDNDNYRDWKQQLRDDLMRVWLDKFQDLLQMRYYFDSSIGFFETIDGSVPAALLAATCAKDKEPEKIKPQGSSIKPSIGTQGSAIKPSIQPQGSSIKPVTTKAWGGQRW